VKYMKGRRGRGDVSRHGRPRRLERLYAAALVVASQLACASSQPSAYDQFTVPPERFLETTRTIALFPLSADVDVPQCLDSISEHAMTTDLEAAGFSLIPSFVQQEIWMRITEDAGGFYDPLTGELDEVRSAAGVQRFRAELRAKDAPDAILYPHVWAVEASAVGGRARWDGTSEAVSRLLGDLVLALSYVIVVEDLEGTPMFVNGGGLQVAERWDTSSDEVVSVSAEDLCAEPDRIIRAVDIALAPLMQRASARPPTP
jgi:hypothetical protein